MYYTVSPPYLWIYCMWFKKILIPVCGLHSSVDAEKPSVSPSLSLVVFKSFCDKLSVSLLLNL
jgi:hypothetical protein